MCPICDGSASFAFRSPHAEVLLCDACGHLFAASRAPGTGVMALEEHDPERFGDRDKQLVRRLQRDGILPPRARVLDFGAGTGHLAQTIRDHSEVAEVHCIEADPGAAAALRSRRFQTWDTIEAAPRDFDVLLMVEVIEHLDDPITVLQALHGKVRPGGLLFLTTPCGETTRGSRKTNAYDTPFHLQFFTEHSLNLALRRAGFSGLAFRTMNELYPDEGFRSRVKNWLRPARARLLGHHHLTGYAANRAGGRDCAPLIGRPAGRDSSRATASANGWRQWARTVAL